MIEQYKIIEKAAELLKDSPELDGAVIEQSDVLNANPERSPWIGVYPDTEQFDPKYVGGIDSWEREIIIRVHIQIASGREGALLERKISKYIKAIISAVYADTSKWYGLLDRFTQIRVEHGFREDDQGSMLFRESTVLFTGTVSSGVQ